MSKVFPKLAKSITMAAKSGGPDPESNATLRVAINNANIVSVTEDAQGRTAESTYQCDGSLDADARVRCTLTTRDRSFIDAERLKLVLTTDRGVANLSW